jgi:tRNA-dihydrouridine synthase B
MFTIGNLSLSIPCVLAPMAGVSDLPFRLITRSFGAPLAFAEMVDVRGLSHRDKKTAYMLASSPQDRPLGVQLLGNDEALLAKALEVLDGYEFDLLDFNAACPTPKVTRKGKGAALLQHPRRLQALLKVLVHQSKVPVTVKIRTGWDADSVNARDIALRAQDAGVSALFVHGRTKTQGYGGTVDYRSIREVKAALSIPVIASGDNVSLPAVQKMLAETGCDGVALARGALGNPWIFREVKRFYQHGELCPAPDPAERMAVMERHLRLLTHHYGEKRGVVVFRKFFIWYTRGLKGMKPLRDKVFRADTIEEVLATIEAIGGIA